MVKVLFSEAAPALRTLLLTTALLLERRRFAIYPFTRRIVMECRKRDAG